MSQSPLKSVSAISDEAQDYAEAHRHLSRMVRSGLSWSGNERHCLYVNTGGPRFASVSGLSGFDYPEDARAIAVTDWDRDGDLDLFILNRTSPQLRFLRNTTSAHPSLTVALPPDEIGARLTLRSESGESWVRDVTAGSGFLSQSTARVHFGLGGATGPFRLELRRAGGTVESYRDLQAGRTHEVGADGRIAAVAYQAPPAPPEHSAPVDASPPSITRLAHPLPLPAHWTHDLPRDRHHLLNVWASWCRPCLAELKEFTEGRSRFQSAGLDVVALSVDGLGDEEGSPERAARFLQSIDFPFRAVPAAPELLKRLQLVDAHVYGRHIPLQVPRSYLLDPQGRLLAVVQGRTSVDGLVALLAEPAAEVGQWFRRPGPSPVGSFLTELLDAGLEDDARWILDHAPPDDPTRDEAAFDLANRLVESGRVDEAIPLLETLTEVKGASAWRNLGVARYRAGDLQGAESALRAAVEADPSEAASRRQLGVVLRERDEIEDALAALRGALRLAPSDSVAHAELAWTLAESGDLASAIEHYREALCSDPRPDLRVDLAAAWRDEPGRARHHLEAALMGEPFHPAALRALHELTSDSAYLAALAGAHPDDPDALSSFGLSLARQGDFAAAAAPLSEAARLSPADATHHFNLGLVREGLGERDTSLTAFGQAVELAPTFLPARLHLASQLVAASRTQEGLAQYREVLSLDESNRTAQLNAAWILATDPDPSLRDGTESVSLSTQACESTDYRDPVALDTLAAAQAETGNFDEAVRRAEEALQQARALGRYELAQRIAERLTEYREHRPHRVGG